MLIKEVNRLIKQRLKFFKPYWFAALLFFISSLSFAQIYPVQISTQLIPPYSGYLPDYADPSSEKLRIILQFNDFSKPQYDVKLKIEIKGNGFTLVTKQLFNPPPISIQPGIPLQITGTDLAPYLNSNNLDFIGMNQSQYEQRMALPEGYYSICVTAYDYYNPAKIQVSNQSCANAWFTLSDPPYLNLPLCGKNITPQNPQNIIFQWTPVNIGSPNSANTTEYEFALWEVRPDSSVNPNQIVLSTAPFYSTTTNLTLLNYGITEPPLNLYMKYVWRVRSKDLSGRDWFKNNGYSQICTFVYGTISNVLGNSISLSLNAQGVTHRMGTCNWNSQSVYTKYLLQVRKQGTQNWFDYNTITNSEKITNLEPDTDYEARVRGEGSNIIGDWSNIASFRTLNEPTYGCGDQTQLNDPLPASPLPVTKAVPGLIIQTGQFEVSVTKITPNGQQGWYSGKGFAKVMGLPVAVQFSNIYIDDNNRHQQGTIQAMTQGITSWVQQWDMQFAEENASYVNGTIDSVYVNGNQICVSIQGHEQDSCFTYPANQNVVVVRDENGNQYTVQVNPPPPKITGPTNYFNLSNDDLDATDSMKVVFEQSPNQNFGFDKKKYVAWTNNYEIIKLANGKAYFVPYKSVAENQSDEVYAGITVNGFSAAKLSFKTLSGQTCTSASTGNNVYKVTVPDNAQSVYAWYDNKKIGKLNVVSLKPLQRKLVIVPVNNASLNNQTINSQTLNTIFKQANVTWSIATKSSFSYSLNPNGLMAADANLMSKYSSEMRSLRDAYRKYDSLYDKEAYYVFVVNNFSDPNLKGYMVRGRALGFISASATAKDLAHELAHGAFGLEHTFPTIAKSTSDNLMDYKEGVELGKVQWEEMQRGGFKVSWFDEEEDAQMQSELSNTNILIYESLKQIKLCNTKNINYPVSHIPKGNANHWIINNANIAGDQIPYIKVYNKNSTKNTITPKNNISLTIVGANTSVEYSLITIDNAICIETPSSYGQLIQNYLTTTEGKNMILFVNGYRMIGLEIPGIITTDIPNSQNKVFGGDVFGYWSGIDAKFMKRIGTKNAIYADGHHDITTSNHNVEESIAKSKASFTGNMTMLNASNAANIIPTTQNRDLLFHTKKNTIGFNTRKQNGMNAAGDLIQKIIGGTIVFNKLTDTLDIVAHSMGYAYAVGMVEALKAAGFKFGRFYIIAPENACSGGLDWEIFTEVWQYGSNLDQTSPDPVNKQDGVAPQCEVVNITNTYVKTKTGRIFIPPTVDTKGFVGSHSIGNYGWIFSKTPQEKGYVKPRN